MPISISRSVLVAGALAVSVMTASVAQAATSPRVEARVGMTEAQFKAANEQFFAQGLRLVDITVAQSQGKPVIGALWWWNEGMPTASAEQVGKLQDHIYLKKSESELRELMQQLGTQPEVIDSYSAGGKVWFAAVLPPDGEKPMQPVGLFFTNDDVARMRADGQANGFDLVRLDAYVDSNGVRFLPTFGRRPAAQIKVMPESDPAAIPSLVAKMSLTEKKSPMAITMQETAPGKITYVAAFDDVPGRELRVLLSADAFAKELATRASNGGYPVDLDSYAFPDGVRYAAVFATAPKKVDTNAYKTMGDQLEKIIQKKK